MPRSTRRTATIRLHRELAYLVSDGANHIVGEYGCSENIGISRNIHRTRFSSHLMTAEHFQYFDSFSVGQCICDPEGNLSLRRRIGCSKKYHEREAAIITKRIWPTNPNKFRATGLD